MTQEINPIGPMKVQIGKDDYTFHLEKDVSWEDWKRITESIPEEMYWRKSSLRQNEIIDKLPLQSRVVCSSHTSKSCKLPVVRAMVTPTVLVVIRGNFYDWKVSVVSEKPLHGIDNTFLFDPEAEHSSVYFEGFHDNWCYGSYKANPAKFSVELIYSALDLYTFIKELQRVADTDDAG